MSLAGNTAQALKILMTLKAVTGSLKAEKAETFTIKDFLSCFRPDQLGTNICKKINEQFMAEQN